MIPLRDSQPSHGRPLVTAAIIVVNVAVFLYEVSLDPFSANHFIEIYGVVPEQFELHTLATSMFLHGGWLHLIGNMWFLWIYGDNVEDILGHAKYVIFYLSCGIAASLVHIGFNPASHVPAIGASGAIAGVMGAYLVKFPHSRIVTLVPLFFIFYTVEIPALIILVYWFIIQIFSGFGSLGQMAASEGGGVAWFAHVGGFVAGIVLIKVMRARERYRLRGDLRW
jgi:membrane associated rhomboid family serine protease